MAIASADRVTSEKRASMKFFYLIGWVAVFGTADCLISTVNLFLEVKVKSSILSKLFESLTNFSLALYFKLS